MVVVWHDPDLVYIVSFFQPPFSQPDHSPIGWARPSVSGSTTESPCTSANPGYMPTPHQSKTPLPPCSTFCTKVGTSTEAATLPKWWITSVSKHNHRTNMPNTLLSPALHVLCSPWFSHLPLGDMVGAALCLIHVFVLLSRELRLRLRMKWASWPFSLFGFPFPLLHVVRPIIFYKNWDNQWPFT